SLMPATSRSSPALEPVKAGGASVPVGSPTGVTDSARRQPSTPAASRTSEQGRRAKDMTVSPPPNAEFTCRHLLQHLRLTISWAGGGQVQQLIQHCFRVRRRALYLG